MPILPRFSAILESEKLVKDIPGDSRFFFAATFFSLLKDVHICGGFGSFTPPQGGRLEIIVHHQIPCHGLRLRSGQLLLQHRL
jgi:hypothetical protein